MWKKYIWNKSWIHVPLYPINTIRKKQINHPFNLKTDQLTWKKETKPLSCTTLFWVDVYYVLSTAPQIWLIWICSYLSSPFAFCFSSHCSYGGKWKMAQWAHGNTPCQSSLSHLLERTAVQTTQLQMSCHTWLPGCVEGNMHLIIFLLFSHLLY